MCDCATAEASGEPIDEDDARSLRDYPSFPSFEGFGGWFPYIGASIILVTLIRYIYKNSDKISDKLSLSNLGSLSLNGVKSLGSVGNLVTLRSLTNFGGFRSWRGSSSTGVTSTAGSGSIGSWGRSGSSTTTEIREGSGGRGWSIPRPSWGRSGGATDSSATTASASGSGTAGGGGWSIGSWGRSGSTEGTKTGGVTDTGTAGGGGWRIGNWGKSGSTEGTKTGRVADTGTAGGGSWSISSWGRSGSTEGTKTEGATGSSAATANAKSSLTDIPSVPGNSNNVGWVWGKPDITEGTRSLGETGSKTKTETTGGFSERTASTLKPETKSDATGSRGRITSEASKDGAGALVGTGSTIRSYGSEGKSKTKGAGIWSGPGQPSSLAPLHSTPESRIRDEVDNSTSPGSWPKSGAVLSGISGQAKGDEHIPDITTDTKRKEDIERTEGSENQSGKTGESRSRAGRDTIKSTIKPRERIDTTHETIERKGEIYGTVKSPETKAEIDSSRSGRDRGKVTVIDRVGKETPPDSSTGNIDTTVRDRDSSADKGGSTISKGFEKKGGRYGKSSVPRRKDELDSAEPFAETKYSAGPDVTSSISEKTDEFRASRRDSSRTGDNSKGRRSEDTTSSSGRFQAEYDRTGESISGGSERKRGSERKESSGSSDVTDSKGGYGGNRGSRSRNGFESTDGYGGRNGYGLRDNNGISNGNGSSNTYGSKAITGSAGRSDYSEVTDSKDNGTRQNGSNRSADNNDYRRSSDKRGNGFPLPPFESIINNKDQQTGSCRSTESTGTSSGGTSTTRRSICTTKRRTSTPRSYRSGATWQREAIEGTSSQIPNGKTETSDLPQINEDDEQIMEKRKKDPCYGIYRRRKSTVEARHEQFHDFSPNIF